MDGPDVLALFAEIFAAFAGFTGIVAVLGQRSDGVWRPIDVVRFQGLLYASLIGLVLCTGPLALLHLGTAPEITWRACCALLLVCIVAMFSGMIMRQKKIGATGDPDFVPHVRATLLVLSVPVGLLLAATAAGMGPTEPFAAYLVGLLLLLTICSAMFALLLRFVSAGK